MTPATLSADWPLDAASASRVADVPAGAQREWHLQRRCAMTPRQLGRCLLVLIAVSLAVGIGFWVAGLPLITAFTGIELAAVLVAFGVHARHAADGEQLMLTHRDVRIERRRGACVEHVVLPRAGLRVSAGADRALVLAAAGRVVRVGELAQADARLRVGRELRDALAA